MTNEQKVRVDRLERYLISDRDKIYTRVRVNDLDTVLSLIKEQEEKIDKLKRDNADVWCLNSKMSRRHLDDICKLKQKDKQIDLIKEYTHQEIVHYTETIKDYIDDDKEGNKHYIEELKEKREHWRDVEKLLQNKPKEELYMNWWKYGLYE